MIPELVYSINYSLQSSNEQYTLKDYTFVHFSVSYAQLTFTQFVTGTLPSDLLCPSVIVQGEM